MPRVRPWRLCCKSLPKPDDRPGIASMSARKNSTKRRLRVTALACLAVAAVGGGATAEEKIQKLTGGENPRKAGGMEQTDKVHRAEPYHRKGTVMSTSIGRKRT